MSYIITKQRRDMPDVEQLFHIEADNIGEAAAKAKASVDNLWEIIKVEKLQ